MLDQLDLFDEESTRPGRHRRRRRDGGGGRSAATLLITFVALGALVLGGWVGFNKVRDFFAPPDYEGPGTGSVTVEVKVGDYASDIGNELYNKGVVASAAAFVKAAEEDARSREIQPGKYQLKKKMSARAALEALLDPKNRLVIKVTVPEGQSNVRVYRTLSEKLGVSLEELEELDKRPTDFGIDESWFTRTDGKQAAKTLEGFLYPSTYEFDPGTTAVEALQTMVSKFLSVAEELNLQQVAQQKNITPYEALIVASLAEAEVVPEDLPKATRVVYNRLEHPDAWMNKLQFDSTTNYWLEKQGKARKDSSGLTLDELNDPENPYSTHAHAGLPPGPIGNPSNLALMAAINPEQGDWLFFVVTSEDGRSSFAATYEEHQQNIQICKQKNLGC